MLLRPESLRTAALDFTHQFNSLFTFYPPPQCVAGDFKPLKKQVVMLRTIIVTQIIIIIETATSYFRKNNKE